MAAAIALGSRVEAKLVAQITHICRRPSLHAILVLQQHQRLVLRGRQISRGPHVRTNTLGNGQFLLSAHHRLHMNKIKRSLAVNRQVFDVVTRRTGVAVSFHRQLGDQRAGFQKGDVVGVVESGVSGGSADQPVRES